VGKKYIVRRLKIIPIADAHQAEALKVSELLKSANIRVELDPSTEGFGKKVRQAKTEKIPYFIIIGDKDLEAKKVTLESRDKGNLGQLTPQEILTKLEQEIAEKK